VPDAATFPELMLSPREVRAMSLSTRQRSSIYQKLIPVLGEEDADALMAEFPATEHDQLVTRDHLRAELALVRGDLHSEMQGLATELRSEMQGLRGEVHDLRTEVHAHINRAMATSTGVLLAAMGVFTAVA
jgi:hypothetical protein